MSIVLVVDDALGGLNPNAPATGRPCNKGDTLDPCCVLSGRIREKEPSELLAHRIGDRAGACAAASVKCDGSMCSGRDTAEPGE